MLWLCPPQLLYKEGFSYIKMLSGSVLRAGLETMMRRVCVGLDDWLQGDRAPRGLSFVYTFVKCSAGRRADTVFATLPNWKTGTSYFDVSKT